LLYPIYGFSVGFSGGVNQRVGGAPAIAAGSAQGTEFAMAAGKTVSVTKSAGKPSAR
jgi:hypothetical protein